MDIKLESFQTLKKMGVFFKKLFRELLVIQKIKKSDSKRLLKYHGFSARINRYLCLEVNLLSDLMVTDLNKYMTENFWRMTFLEKLEISLKIAEGIRELQELKIIHSDIKPHNILIDSNGSIFIADYGTCMMTKFEQTFISGTINATLRFAPPELLIHHFLSKKVRYPSTY